MSARILAPRGALAGKSFRFDQEITLGRTKDNQVVIDHPLVSGHHARIVRDDALGCFVIEDRGSRNGTFVAGMRIAEREPLGNLDVIDLGGALELLFQVVAAPGTAAGEVSSERVSAPTHAEEAARARVDWLPPPAAMAGQAVADRMRTRGDDAADWALPQALDAEAAAEQRLRTLGEAGVDWKLPEAVGGAVDDALAREQVQHTRAEEPVEWVLPGAGAGGTAPDPAPSVPESEEITRITRARQQRTPARLPSPEPVDEAPPLALEIHLPGGVLETVALRSGTYLVGRSPSSQIVIDHETLSRSHARIDVEGQSARVLDLDSTNHTFVEGQRTCGAVDVPVGGAVRFGAIETKLVRTGREARNTPKVR